MFARRPTLAVSLLFPLLGIALAAGAAGAQCPSIAPQCIMVVGSNGGVADPAGTFFVTVIDPVTCLPVPGAIVLVDFSQCAGVSICFPQPDPLVSLNCATKTVSKAANAAGVASFDITGGWSVPPGAPCPAQGCAIVSAVLHGVIVPISRPNVTAVDLDNAGGLTAADLSAWLSTFFGSQCLIGDYDCTGTLGPSDLTTWLSIFFKGGSLASCAVSCP